MSEFLGTEDTILFGSCFDANGAVFEALLGEEDEIFSDALVHASIIDGERLAKKVPRNIYPHSDMAELEKLLSASKARLKMIITDGVFSMDGDMAKLDEIVALAEKYDAMVFVDDSHATGFIGKTGRGTHEHFNVMNKVDIITTTFGKALGGASGGCVSGKKEIVSLLRQRGRPYLFSNAVPPAIVSGTLKVLEILSSDTARRDKLADLAIYWRDLLTKAGFDLKAGNTPIVPVMLYDAKIAQEMAKQLFEEGVYVRGFFYPVVAQGQARIRTQMSAGLEKSDLDEALKAFVKVGKKLGVLK
jgi:glycine C-acetyltransferase